MKKVIILITILSIFIAGCSEKNFYLSGEYYKSDVLEINDNDLDKLINNKKSFILFVYNPFCNFKVSCEEVFVNTLKNENITLLKIPFNSFKLSKFYKKVKYGPSILIINNGKLVKYLDASDDNDYDIYQDEEKFKEWLSFYIYLNKMD